MIPANINQFKQNYSALNEWATPTGVQNELPETCSPSSLCYFCDQIINDNQAVFIFGGNKIPLLINDRKVCITCGFSEFVKHALWSLPGFESMKHSDLGYWANVASQAIHEAADSKYKIDTERDCFASKLELQAIRKRENIKK